MFPGDELCFFYDEFVSGRHLIADTVVPCISEWLFHYELWLSTGEWHGGGLHPEEEPAGGRRRERYTRARRAPRRGTPSAPG
ncbi:hypothetical protein IN07_20325 [Modestobacter caceresii]|uniref:Type II CBASS E2 protein domain-containing protein n=1 Tax=Modestobacter caceresii TaxID=1522368 RepID=A0A098Y3A5_9ACTN|nr:hypothetical protein [Modestobacter caceresii]KGH44954.1 hypothetical protein IN07_20325 [Modestobacter caceresii]